MAKHNFGNDLMLDENSDLFFNDNGDYATTEDMEAKVPSSDLPFLGYTCLKETIYNVLLSEKRDFVFDIETGANVPLYVSKAINDKLNDLKLAIKQELIKDDRIEIVNDVIIDRFPQQNMITIGVYVTAIGQSEISKFVFPYSLL